MVRICRSQVQSDLICILIEKRLFVMRFSCIFLHVAILSSSFSTAYFIHTNTGFLEDRHLIQRARIGRCEPEQRRFLQATLRIIVHLSSFAIRTADITRTRASQADLGHDEERLRVFDHQARIAFQQRFVLYFESVRRDVSQRFRFLKYEAERSEGGVLENIHTGRVRLVCDNDRTTAECRDNARLPFVGNWVENTIILV